MTWTALLVGNSRFDDHSDICNLRCPKHDLEEFARLVKDQELGKYELLPALSERNRSDVETTIEGTFKDAAPGDRILLYYSGHGLPDEHGRLHLATSDSFRDRLGSTAIAADRIHKYINASSAETILIILDCCYSGSFGDGIKAPHLPFRSLEELKAVNGRGRGIFILAASSTDQAAKEGEGGACSVFTRHLIDGIRNRIEPVQGTIGFDALYNHVNAAVAQEVYQNPMRIVLGEGTIPVAFVPPRRQPLPPPRTISRHQQEQPKSLIVCCDGADDGRAGPTNAEKLHAALSARSPSSRPQLTFYDRRRPLNGYQRELIGPPYTFLTQHFQPGDRIYIFGGGGGGRVAVALAEMITDIGIYENSSLLHHLDNGRFRQQQQVFQAMVPQSSNSPFGMQPTSISVRPDLVSADPIVDLIVKCQKTSVEMLGLWDPQMPRRDSKGWLHGDPVPVFQALAIDQRSFFPTIWSKRTPSNYRRVWFPGGRLDVVGGADSSGLSDIALAWMIEKAKASGLAFNTEYLDAMLHPDHSAPAHIDRTWFGWARKMGQVAGIEYVHSSAGRRQQMLKDYQPKNLLSALSAGIPVVDA
jgi:hypothetical protein